MKVNIKIIITSLLLLTLHSTSAQTIKQLTSGTKTSIRGLCAVSEKVIWVSGSAGTIGKSVDSGNTWKWMTIKGFEKTEFSFGEGFYLPDNFEMTDKEIRFIYNPYEVSNWANGIVEFSIPLRQLKPYLKRAV
jgi:hypothetical protein